MMIRVGTAIYVAFYASLVDDFVDVVGRDSGLRGGGSDIKDLSRQAAHLTHGILALGVEDLNFVTVR